MCRMSLVTATSVELMHVTVTAYTNLHSLIPRLFPPPVFDRFQHEIRWGKAWEIWSHAVLSGRHMVDTRRVVPNEESRFPVLYCPSKGWMLERSQGRRSNCSLFTMPGMDPCETGIITVRHHPLCVYHLST